MYVIGQSCWVLFYHSPAVALCLVLSTMQPNDLFHTKQKTKFFSYIMDGPKTAFPEALTDRTITLCCEGPGLASHCLDMEVTPATMYM